MIGTRVVDLPTQWSLLTDPPTCEHYTLELKKDEAGCYLTGH